MPVNIAALGIDKLSVRERLELIEQIWDSLPEHANPDEVPRTWALAVGQDLVSTDPSTQAENSDGTTMSRLLLPWRGFPTESWSSTPRSLATGPMTLLDWARAMRARSIEISAVPLTQAQILQLQTAQVTSEGQPLDAVLFSLPRGQAPLPDVGGSGFRIGPDPPEGASAFSHQQQQKQKYLQLESKMRPGQPWPSE
jgi:Putative addiction module component